MPQSDTLTPSPAPVKRPRDPRIDAFRGLALAMIFVDHVPGNPYEELTLRNFGFSDAAEAFFLMSGIAAGLAYSGRFLPQSRAENGLWAAVKPMWKRSWTLYLVQLFLTVWAIGMFAAAANLFDYPKFLEMHNLKAIFETPAETLIGLPLLLHQIGFVNILPAYSVLLFFAPLAIMIGLKRPVLLLAGSLALWFFAGVLRLNLPNFPNDGGWFFNPMAWQAIFVIGLLTGIFMRRGERFVPYRGWLFWCAVSFLVLVLVWRFVPPVGAFLNHQMARMGSMGVPFNVVSHNKTYLASPRFLHAIALAYVLSCLPIVRAACAHKMASPLRVMGRHGLLVFSLGTIMALAMQIAMRVSGSAWWAVWIMPLVGLGVLWGVAWIAEANKQARPFLPRRAAPSAPVAHGDITVPTPAE